MKLHLTYCSSDEGVKLIRLFKYIMHTNPEYELSYEKNDWCALSLLFLPANKTITGYDNIRTALKSVFPTLFDLTPTKRMPIRNLDLRKKKYRLRNLEHYAYWKDKGMLEQVE